MNMDPIWNRNLGSKKMCIQVWPKLANYQLRYFIILKLGQMLQGQTYKGACTIFGAISYTVPGLGFEFRFLRLFTQIQSHIFGTQANKILKKYFLNTPQWTALEWGVENCLKYADVILAWSLITKFQSYYKEKFQRGLPCHIIRLVCGSLCQCVCLLPACVTNFLAFDWSRQECFFLEEVIEVDDLNEVNINALAGK